jgi:colanic acid biosynthesis glycosyl transferase WcaI
MNLTILCPHLRPDLAPTGEVMSSIAEGWIEAGHRLHVVTALPWYMHHAVEPGWEGRLVRHEDLPWGRVTRVHPFPTDKTNIPARALAFGGFTVLAGVMAAFGRRRPDAVLAMSPPLTLGVAGWLVARARRAPFVFNIQDVFPDVAVETGMLKGRRVIAAAEALERFVYRRADAVTVLSDDLRDNVTGKLPPEAAAKVRVIPNFIDTGRIGPEERENSYRREFGLEGKTVVMYAGNLGFSQPVDLLLDAAADLAHERDLVFVVNGGGSARSALERRARGMTNVRFVDLQPKERLGEVLAAADIHTVLLGSGLARSSVPSKLYSILAAARPIVASVDPGTEVARTIDAAGAGVSVPPGDAEALTKALRRLIDEPEEAARMGRAGRAFVENWPTPAEVAARYEALFDEQRARSRADRR